MGQEVRNAQKNKEVRRTPSPLLILDSNLHVGKCICNTSLLNLAGKITAKWGMAGPGQNRLCISTVYSSTNNHTCYLVKSQELPGHIQKNGKTDHTHTWSHLFLFHPFKNTSPSLLTYQGSHVPLQLRAWCSTLSFSMWCSVSLRNLWFSGVDGERWRRCFLLTPSS
jgi:hypothetical protein